MSVCNGVLKRYRDYMAASVRVFLCWTKIHQYSLDLRHYVVNCGCYLHSFIQISVTFFKPMQTNLKPTKLVQICGPAEVTRPKRSKGLVLRFVTRGIPVEWLAATERIVFWECCSTGGELVYV